MYVDLEDRCYFDEDQVCESCDESTKKLEAAAHYFEGVVEEVFGEGRLRNDRLYDMMEEVAHVLGVKLPNQEIRLERRKSRSDFLNDWVSFNNEYMKSIV